MKDAAACLNFIWQYDLFGDFKLNIETKHATPAGHTMQHELEVAATAAAPGSSDTDYGDLMLGRETDQFPTDVYLTSQVMLVILRMGGFTTGGLIYDGRLHTTDFEPMDSFCTRFVQMKEHWRVGSFRASWRIDWQERDANSRAWWQPTRRLP